jgi:heme exporter protein D
MDPTTYNALYVIFGFFVILLSVLWVLIPFAVFGIKPLLRDLLRELRRNNELQDQALAELRLARPRVVEVRDPV